MLDNFPSADGFRYFESFSGFAQRSRCWMLAHAPLLRGQDVERQAWPNADQNFAFHKSYRFLGPNKSAGIERFL